ncbi:immunoglobulin-like domain-containing protein [Clostridium sp.]|uniref:immunoglobulin-like domain-containing protein n=1 Tax=Clostridium sp. TaxID=1506 RepID=UPI0029124ADE|nr:immunoglobulin-like domain-containing protein [Clostridium sp.]MDU6522152.1 DUF5011 domain-containing protein [Clostridium sp.]
MENQSIELNSSTNLRKNTFSRDGYIFKGWSRQPKGNVDFADEQEVQNLANIAGEKVILYAVWSKNLYDINSVPTINATYKELTVGENFNPLEGVTAHDNEDGDIELTDANIILNNVNTNVAGTYNVTYKIADNNGASIVKIITVIVKEKEVTEPIELEQPSQPNDTTKPNKPNGQNNIAQTGDISNVALITSMFASSSGLLAVILGERFKRK